MWKVSYYHSQPFNADLGEQPPITSKVNKKIHQCCNSLGKIIIYLKVRILLFEGNKRNDRYFLFKERIVTFSWIHLNRILSENNLSFLCPSIAALSVLHLFCLPWHWFLLPLFSYSQTLKYVIFFGLDPFSKPKISHKDSLRLRMLQ